MTQQTYRAFQVIQPGRMEWVELPLPSPGRGQVRIRVDACGVCHTDAWTVEGNVVDIAYPRVPGHEIVGRIDALGVGVTGWEIGQRVGVGFLAGACGRCQECRRGNFTTCRNQQWTGIHHDGGYAEVTLANADALVVIPDQLEAAEAAPLLCAGITVFKALKKALAQPGETVAIQGIGGLGHLALQFAKKMGFRTIAIARGPEKAALARSLGAHHYIDSAAGDAAKELKALGGADVIVSTIANTRAITPLLAGLALHGRMVVVGLGSDPIEVSAFALVPNDISISGSLTGSTIETEDSLEFSVLQDIRARIEMHPLQDARLAYDRMMRNEVQFRAVLTV